MSKVKVFDNDILMKREPVHKAPSGKKSAAIIIPLLVLALFILTPYL